MTMERCDRHRGEPAGLLRRIERLILSGRLLRILLSGGHALGGGLQVGAAQFWMFGQGFNLEWA